MTLNQLSDRQLRAIILSPGKLQKAQALDLLLKRERERTKDEEMKRGEQEKKNQFIHSIKEKLVSHRMPDLGSVMVGS